MPMIRLRDYHRDDAPQVGKLIKDTYSKFNLNFLPIEELADFLGPFQQAESTDPAHQEAIHQVICSEIVILAEDGDKIVGILRGRMDRLASLFVGWDYHHQGVARALVNQFEERIRKKGGMLIRVASTLYAVPFYQKMGYKKSTGVRQGTSFLGHGLPIQPMKKMLA